MSTAQKLYENGFITYMRTDSTHLSEEAIAGSRNVIKKLYGKDYLPDKAIEYSTKVRNAQEAHEAIRPAHREFRSVDDVQKVLGDDASKLYDLIWKRTISSQMQSAELDETSIDITSMDRSVMFRANGSQVFFPGFYIYRDRYCYLHNSRIYIAIPLSGNH